jgi:hypothetical protein
VTPGWPKEHSGSAASPARTRTWARPPPRRSGVLAKCQTLVDERRRPPRTAAATGLSCVPLRAHRFVLTARCMLWGLFIPAALCHTGVRAGMPPAPDRCRSAKSLCADPGGSVSAPAKRHSGALAPANDTAFPTNDSFPERRQRRIPSHAAGLQLTVDLTVSRQLRCSSSGAAPSRPQRIVARAPPASPEVGSSCVTARRHR